MKRFSTFKLFVNKKGLTLIEAMIAIVILVFPIMATLSSVSFLYKQTNSRNLELLAENLNNYILEDLRGRKFFDSNYDPYKSLNGIFEHLQPYPDPVPNPFFEGAELEMRYAENLTVSSDNLYFDFSFKKSDGNDINLSKFYNAFKFDVYITRYPLNIENPDNIYETIYKLDLILKWNEGKRERILKSSTEIAYHEP